MKLDRSRRRRWALRLVKWCIVGLVCWGIYRAAGAAVEQLAARHWSPATLEPWWLVAAVGLYLVGNLPSGLFWYQILKVLGEPARPYDTLRAYYIGHLGKYVPGKALVVVLRAGLLRNSGVDTTTAAVAVFYETLTSMAAGAFVGGATLAIWFRHKPVLMVLALGMMLAAGVPTLPPVFRRLVRLVGVGRANPGVVERLNRVGMTTWLGGWLSISAGWVLIGASLWTTLLASGFASWPGNLDDWVVCLAAATLAMVAGFLSLIPAGAGVREFVLLELLPPAFGEAAALVSTILARLVWLVAELIISGILYAIPARASRPLATQTDQGATATERG